ncbi:zinc-dependent metalloprotease [Aliikangiella sp. IMCC44632]
MKKLLGIVSVLLVVFVPQVFAKKLAELEQLYNLDNGFVSIIFDKEEDKIYFKIDNLEQQFIYQTSLPSGLGSNDIGLDRGQLSETRLVEFEKVGNKVFLKQIPTNFRAKTKNKKEADAVSEAFAASVLWGFPVVDSRAGWALVDATEFAMQDIHGVAERLQQTNQGKGFKVDKSRSALYMPRTTAFPDNTEVESIITLVGSSPGKFLRQTAPEPTAVTVKMRHSFVRLPKPGYKKRSFHPKSGFWNIEYKDYAQPINTSITQKYIARHRLEKKNPNAKVSEAVKPIVYYLDPGVPEPVKSALIEGALWWNQAFEAIGYKNAFQVKMLPANADPMDVRYNVIQWVHRATRGWSYGASVVDPRTGEIIKGHVTLGSLRVRQDYLIAQGMLAPFAQSQNDDVLMKLALARIKQLSAHEVGHTLGLSHNFAASSYGKESVMDYPHPQFMLNGNKVAAPNPYAEGIAKWDKAAIRYGYQTFTDGKADKWLRQIIAENDQQGLLFISDRDARSPGSAHAQASLWDNGGDSISELKNMFAIRAAAIANFGPKNLKMNQPWSDLEEIFVPVYYFHRFQITAVAKSLGGYFYDYSIKRSSEAVKQEMVSGEKQMQALQLMLSSLSPEFLSLTEETAKLFVPKAAGSYRTRESINGETGVVFDQVHLARASAQHTLGLIFHPQRLARIIQQHGMDPQIPSIDGITTEIHQTVIEKNYEGIQATIHQAVVDLIYANYLNLLNDSATSQAVKMQIMGIVIKEKEYLTRKLTTVRKTSSYYGFYAFQAKRLEDYYLNRRSDLIELPKMPPGSPI